MKQPEIDWPEAIKPLLRKYKNKPQPLDAKNLYQCLVMVVLSAQTTDSIINGVAAELFKYFRNMQALSAATEESVIPYITKVRNFRNKAKWLTATARQIKKDTNIPLNLENLVQLPGIGRKSANVILRYAGVPPEGLIVDLHVLRVALRLGIASVDDATKMEKQIMEQIPPKQWEVGMALSFLGREICKPKPECDKCMMNKVCAFYNKFI